MSTINQRINVTFNNSELEAIKLYAEATNRSLSQAVAGLALRSLEELDDVLLAEKAVRRLQKSTANSWLSMEDFEKAFDGLPE
jgi:predicted DNA-binding protein